MWPKVLARRLGIEYPILLAPMAGGPGTPDLAAAVSEAGGLGSLGAAYLAPDALREAIRDIRARTSRPFAVNLFVPERSPTVPGADELAGARASLEPFRRELGLAASAPTAAPPDFAAQLAVVKAERAPVFSFTFGSLAAGEVADLHARGVTVLGTATTLQEARVLAESGVDAVVAQGAEAGGHRGTFAARPERALIGTLALVPQVVDAVEIPVVAAGGIMDGRGIVAAFALGAAAVQMGTAFLACVESGAHPLHKKALLERRDEDATRLTRAFSGRLGRALGNRFVVEVERAGAILPYPHQGALTSEIRQAAGRQGRAELLPMFAGQGAPLATAKRARELVRDLVQHAERVANGLH